MGFESDCVNLNVVNVTVRAAATVDSVTAREESAQ